MCHIKLVFGTEGGLYQRSIPEVELKEQDSGTPSTNLWPIACFTSARDSRTQNSPHFRRVGARVRMLCGLVLAFRETSRGSSRTASLASIDARRINIEGFAFDGPAHYL
ncbi:hypothetical protein EVAR_71546_1 [Eumeta japonica]|uniref:Uncharacterized protein n=1 Tax=Eumeta variegata TaxID=151549 RepID=A0A4C1SWJ7_EUMVA|nr:hypothetical protein EVAR_71546_1 [Eumeta japonica]